MPDTTARLIEKSEGKNVDASVDRLGDTLRLFTDVLEAYEAFGPWLRQTADPPHHLWSASIMFLAARYQFKRAGIDCVRCRLTDCKQATRRAIELTAFAHRIHRHPHLAEVWADASKDDNAYDRYRKKFSGKALFPADHEALQILSKSYDYCSKRFHGSPFSVGARTTIELSEGGLEFRFREFECSDQDKSEPAATFLWLIDTHLRILDVFAEVFEAQLGDLMRSWWVRATSLRGKLEEHVAKWRDAIVNAEETPEGVVTLNTAPGNGA